MRLPRKGILIRLAIYVPVIAFLSYGAFCNKEPEPAQAPAAGSEKFQVIEVSPDQAEQMLGRPLPEPGQDESDAPASAKDAAPAPAAPE